MRFYRWLSLLLVFGLLATALTGCQNSISISSLSSVASSQENSASPAASSSVGASKALSESNSLSDNSADENPFAGVPLDQIDFSKAISTDFHNVSNEYMEEHNEEWYVWYILKPFVYSLFWFRYVTSYPEPLLEAPQEPLMQPSDITYWLLPVLLDMDQSGELERYRTGEFLTANHQKQFIIPAQVIVEALGHTFGNLGDLHAIVQKSAYYDSKRDSIVEPLWGAFGYGGGTASRFAIYDISVDDEKTIHITLAEFPETDGFTPEIFNSLELSYRYRPYQLYQITFEKDGEDFILMHSQTIKE